MPSGNNDARHSNHHCLNPPWSQLRACERCDQGCPGLICARSPTGPTQTLRGALKLSFGPSITHMGGLAKPSTREALTTKEELMRGRTPPRTDSEACSVRQKQISEPWPCTSHQRRAMGGGVIRHDKGLLYSVLGDECEHLCRRGSSTCLFATSR